LLRRAFYGALYRDSSGDPRDCVMIAGTARSGTTWLGEIIASQTSCRMMFEPFQADKVGAYRRFQYFQYLRPQQDDHAMSEFCGTVFSGRIRNWWIDQEVSCLRPRLRLVKEIRANLLLGWIARRFPDMPLLFVVRHPCAVVQSRLQLGWATDTDIASFLEQPELIEDFLSSYLGLINRTRSAAGKHAIIWCISNMVPLRQFAAGGLPLVFYEDLCIQPEIELPRIFRLMRLPLRDSVFTSLATPSASSRRRGSDVTPAGLVSGWRRSLTADQVAEVLAVVDAFGLGHLYGDSATPLHQSATGDPGQAHP
jgi:hypothetical protein